MQTLKTLTQSAWDKYQKAHKNFFKRPKHRKQRYWKKWENRASKYARRYNRLSIALLK